MIIPAVMRSPTTYTGLNRPPSSGSSSSTTPSTTPSTGTTPGGGSSTGTQPPSTPSCFYDSAGIKGDAVAANSKLDRLTLISEAIQIYQQQQIKGKLDILDTKLGDQMPNGGISGALKRASDFASKTWDFLQVDRVLNVMTWIAVLHNAYMLSNNIAQTLFSAISISLDVFGVEKADGTAFDVGKIVSDFTEGFFKQIFGVETVEGIKANWKKFNRIYQAATNLMFTMQSLMYSMLDSLEVVGNYVAKIGNAARIFGTFAENAYGWMNPNLNFTENRWFNALNKIQDVTENLEQVAASVKDTQELGAELYNNKVALETALGAEETKLTAAATAAKTGSVSPQIPVESEKKPEP